MVPVGVAQRVRNEPHEVDNSVKPHGWRNREHRLSQRTADNLVDEENDRGCEREGEGDGSIITQSHSGYTIRCTRLVMQVSNPLSTSGQSPSPGLRAVPTV